MARSHTRLVLAASASLLALQACGGGGYANPGNPPPAGSDDFVLAPAFQQLSFSQPVALLQAPGDDTRWFVVEQPGIVRVFDNQANVAASSVFADISARVDDSFNEAGLLGMAFHPDFALNGEVFLSYTRGGPLTSVVSRFTVEASGDSLDEASEEVILEAAQPNSNHNGGNIRFGPDRLLYAGFGDGGGAGDPNGNGQDTSTYLGSIVRIDVDGAPPYEIPGTNPFANNAECMGGAGNASCPEIYAWGFRNPWRFSFDRQGGQLWVGDVGQGSWEEIDRVQRGQNYGWNEREGAHCFASTCSLMNVDPIAEYDRSLGQSVTGGYVYRGTAIPRLVGTYVFGDFVSGQLFSVPADSPQGTVPDVRIDTSLNISSFGQGEDGELYALDYATGTIHKIVPAP